MTTQFSRTNIIKSVLVASCVALLSACGGGDGNTWSSTETVSSVVSGSVGDGPITGATVEIYNESGNLVGSETSDNTASFKSSLRLSRNSYPLILKVSDGIDLVTGDAPDFELVSVAMKSSNTTANINPFSTLIVKMAESMPGGVSNDNIAFSKSVVMDKFSFGLDPSVIDDPVTKRISSKNIAQIVKASEALGEMIRRTRDQITASGRPVSGDDIVNAIAADMADGFLDGMGAKGSDPTIAAVANVVTGQVLVEAMTNTLKVNGVVATVVIDQSILTTHPSTKTTQMSDSVRITSGLLEQASFSVAAAQVVDNSSLLSNLAADINSLSADTKASDAARVLSTNSSSLLNNAIAVTLSASSQDLIAINLTANNTPVPDTGADDPVVKSDPDAGGTDPVEDPVVVNAKPVLSGSPSGSVVATNSYSFNPAASDPDGDTLSFTISNKPGWASFDASTGRLNGTPAEGDVGAYNNIVISVTDGTDTVSLSAFSIEVKANVVATGSMDLSWTAPATRSDGTPLSLADINGYRIYYGESEGSYTESVDIADGAAQSARVTDIPVGSYHVVMTTYDTDGRESGYSGSVVKTIQ
jgi:hypothetical protein